MAKTAVSADFLEEVIESHVRAGPAHSEVAALARLAQGCSAIAIGGPDGAAAERMAARFRAHIAEANNHPTATWLAGWAGAGRRPRPLVQRLAAAGLLVSVVGAAASGAAAGQTPLSAATEAWTLAQHLAANLNPARPSTGTSVVPGTQAPATPSPGTQEPGASAAQSVAPGQTPASGTATTPASTITPSSTGTASVAAEGAATASTTPGQPSATPRPPAAPGSPSANGTQPTVPTAGASPSASPTPTPPNTATVPATASPAAGTPASSPTPAPSPRPSPPATGSPSPEPTATPRPSPTPEASPTPAATATASPPAAQDYAAGAAGTVSLAVSGGSLSLVGVTTNPGWSVSETQTTSTTVQITFVNGGETVEFEAELDGGVVKTQASSSGSDG